MWETGCGGSNSSGANANAISHSTRGVLLLLTALLASVLLYKAWGPLLLITFALVLVVHTCYSLLVNDSLFAPYTLVLLGHTKELCLEAIIAARFLTGQGFQKCKKYYHYLKLRYSQWCSEQQPSAASAEDNMNGRHRNIYRLSTTNDLGEQVSPLNNDPYQSFALNGGCNVARTSTPLPSELIWRKGTQPNGDIGQFTPITNPQNKKATKQSENKQPSLTLMPNETVYSPKGSPWGKSISPKIKSKDSNKAKIQAQTVQTVAGPLLTSSRFNVDPKLYSDITSPGLSSRLTKYASEANTKLTHQHQYGAGQFPKVNLNASPTPLLSPKVVRSRMPVTVRVAPPEITMYCPPDIQNQEKFMNISPTETKEPISAPSVAKVLKKISLKRHASREEDIMLELVKKQRSERALHENQLENFEEMMQKRAREESFTSEEDLSPQSKNERPLKRPKAASSCHDILNSLSSSLHVLSGVKRKAMDTSRSNTPDIEKHFKPSSRSPTRTMSLNIFPLREPATSKEQLNIKIPIATASGEPYQEKPQVKISETKKPVQLSPEKAQSETPKAVNIKIAKIHKEISAPKSEKLTDKLFMKAESQSKEKLRDLINDSTVETKFITDDKDEIKKQDIINMRQNSIRLRLQSMANAISGKSANKIDPDVVIHAEEANPPASSSFTTLSSLTTTTTVNTSPITTTIVPILKTDTESKSPTTKHVTFNLPSSSLSFSSTTSTNSVTSLSALTSNELAKPVESKLAEISNSGGFGNVTTSAAPAYNFGSTSVVAVSTSTISSTTSGFPVTTNITASNNISSGVANILSTSTSSSPSLFAPKTTADSVKAPVSSSSPGFSFGSAAKTNTTIAATTSSATPISFDIPKTTSFTNQQTNSTSSSATPNFGSSLMKSPASVSLASMTPSSAPTFGGDKKAGGFSFGAPSSNQTSSTTASIFDSSTSVPMFSAGSNASITIAAVAPVVTTAAPSFSFGSGADKPASTFSFTGTPAVSTTIPASTQPSTVTFGSGGQTLRSSSSASTLPTFGAASPANSASNSITSAPNPTFGNSAPSMFGTSTNSPSLFSGSSNVSPMFKSSTTTVASTTSATIFGSGSSGFGTSSAPSPASSTPSLFGNSPSVTTTSSKIPSLFGNTPAPSMTNASSTVSPFGGSATQQPGSIFSGTSAPTISSSMFGSSSSSSGLFSNSGNTTQTVANMAPTANPTNGGSVFGQSKSAPNLSFGTTSSTFGSSNPSSAFSPPNTSNTTSAFQMGSSTSSSASLPTFGTIKPSTQFGTSTSLSQANAGSSIFGSTSGSGFGATSNPAPPAFGSSGTNNAFGMQNNTSAPTSAFGTTAPTSAFGTTASSFGSSVGTSSPFGAPSTTSPPSLFGNAATGSATNAPASGSASFSFGGSQPAQQQPQQTQPSAASFSFGGTSNANTGGAVFQFGAPNAPKSGGFNFGAPTSQPTINFTGGSAPPAFNAGTPGAAPAFNATAPNMFSIGSGGSTSRPRASRPRRGR